MLRERRPVMVSACLLGLRCRYDAVSEGVHPGIPKNVHIIPFCPEQLGGLSTPRKPADFVNKKFTGKSVVKGKGRLKNSSGIDVTKNFLKGAEESAKIAEIFGVKKAYMRRRSPSCGYGETYARGRVVKGCGVAAAKLASIGIEIIPIGGEHKS